MFKVWDSNWNAVRLFFALRTQWRMATLSTADVSRVVRVGLDYAAIEPVRRALGMKRLKAKLFSQLQILETAALIAFSEAST